MWASSASKCSATYCISDLGSGQGARSYRRVTRTPRTWTALFGDLRRSHDEADRLFHDIEVGAAGAPLGMAVDLPRPAPAMGMTPPTHRHSPPRPLGDLRMGDVLPARQALTHQPSLAGADVVDLHFDPPVAGVAAR